jgi:predicted metal-binding membrane protein
MGEIPMPGGWMLSLFWVPMCGQTWAAAAASFVAMWAVMMVAMMLPSVLPMLWRLGLAPGALAGAGYFLVWTVLGLAVFTVCTALAETVMQTPALARAVPISMGLVVLLAGAFQFTAWKARHLANCRPAAASDLTVSRRTGTAWRYGVWLGLQCIRACAGLTAILLVIGVMDLRAMAVVAAVITAERLAPAGQRVAWAVGAVSIVAGVYLMARGVWFA